MAAAITLDEIIKNYLIEKGDDSKHGYQRLLQMATNGLNDMNFDVSGASKYLAVELNEQAYIPIPNDSIKIIGVYATDDRGRWIPFAKDPGNNMSMYVQAECGDLSQVKSPNRPFYGQGYPFSNYGYTSESYTNHYRNGENTGGYYNQPGGNVFLFRVNDQMNIVELSTNATNNVILQYLPAAVDGTYMVHPYLMEPLLAWLRYADIRSKKNVSKVDIQFLQRDYRNWKRLAQQRYNSFTEADFKNAFRSAYQASFKF